MGETKQQELLIPNEPAQSTAITPMQLLELATTQGANIEVLERLMSLHERWQANEAKAAYNAAMAKFKANPPTIEKNKHVKFGNTEYDHATLDHVTDRIAEGLTAVGISHRWAVKQEGSAITVSCVLTHSQGHSEETSLTAAPDTSGSKNAIQAIGSAVTYLQRYTLLAATGLAAANSDDDGQAANKVDSRWLEERVEWMANCSSMSELQSQFKQAYGEVQKVGDQKAMAKLIDAKDKRKKELA